MSCRNLGPLEAQYRGCFRKAIAYNMVRNNSMTIDLCIEHCKQMNNAFAFLQDGMGCSCGSEFNESLPTEECNVTCANNQRQYCGGISSFSIYTVCPSGFFGSKCQHVCKCRNQQPCDVGSGICPTGCEENWTGSTCSQKMIGQHTVGCYHSGSSSNKDLPYSVVINNSSLTIEFCSEWCHRNCFGYSGTENNYYCNCGDEYGRYGIGGSCTLPCTGNPSQMCGGSSQNSVVALCPPGTHGYFCGHSCHCANNQMCLYSSGACPSGCSSGWTGSQCNVHDCSVSNGNCSLNETCVTANLMYATTYVCECKAGFARTRMPWDDCVDIDECINNFGGCDIQTTICENQIGTFRCNCLSGYESLNGTHCKDIDECIDNFGGCDMQTTICENQIGTFRCKCLSGYESLNVTHCGDIDECINNSGGCDIQTTICENQIGTFRCKCSSGYEAPNGTHCKDVNECRSSLWDCDELTSYCKNSIGNYSCECLEGFENLNRTHCKRQEKHQSNISTIVLSVFLSLAVVVIVVLAVFVWRKSQDSSKQTSSQSGCAAEPNTSTPSHYQVLDFSALPDTHIYNTLDQPRNSS